MTRNILFFLALSLLVLGFGAVPVQAQNPLPDSLNGRIVHVYLPSDDVDTLFAQNMNDLRLTKVGYWHTGTLKGGPYDNNDGFFFSTPGRRMNLSKSGFATAEGTRIQKADFQGKKEMWIIVDPAGPINAPPVIMLEPPKIVNILNPWETTGPRLVVAGGRKTMVTVHDHCGWFQAFLLKPTDLQLHFEEINGTDTYGKGGLGSNVNYDLTAEFASKGVALPLGTILWLDTDLNTWLPAHPNKDGNCQYMMAATVRDFSKDHPDFEHGAAQYVVVKGMVETNLGLDRKPVRTTKTAPWPIFNDFNSWWKADSTNANPKLRSYEACVDIPMSKSNDGLWEYDSYKTPERGFYPIDNFNRHAELPANTCYAKPNGEWPNTPPHNMNFCMESHASFIYRKGQKFEFRGDDDVWVFIDGKLVIDLGGLHVPANDTVNLDALNLVEGKEYKWDFFYCERQPCGSSLKIKTSIFFRQQKSLFTEEELVGPGTVRVRIMKREGGKGSCAGLGDTAVEVKPAGLLTYQLWDALGKVLAPLGNGTFYEGGVVIATPNVTVDTSKIRSLPAGNYRIVAFEPANEKVRVEIPFKVNARNLVEFMPSQDKTVPLGTLVRVIVANKEKGLLVAQADKYVPSFPAGLDVYLDSARTQKVGAATVLTTDATGYDTLWVTDAVMAAADKVYTLTIPITIPTVKITFVVPKNKVEFEPPYAGTYPLGTLVPVIAANREAGVLMAKAETWTPVLPPGLEVFLDAGRTQRVAAGTVLTTAATGYDTLWVTGTSTATTDQTYVLSIPGSTKNVSLTFLVPKNRVEFEPPYSKDTLVGSLVRLTAANREAGVLVPKAEPYTLVIPPGLEVYTDAAKTNRVANGAVINSSADGWDTLWVTADSTDPEDKTYILEIAGSPKKVTLTFRMPPLVIPKALTATIHDGDGDGIPDRLAVTYDRDISGSLPKAVEYKWPASGAATAIPPADLPAKVTGPNLVHLGALTASPSTSGVGVFSSTYKARKRDSVQIIPILDRIGPIIVKAEMVLGLTHDTLRIKLSEPILTGRITAAPEALFGYKLLPDAAPVALIPLVVLWNPDNTEISLVFLNTSPDIPRAGNLVRINDGSGLIGDAQGNTAGPASRFRLITGLKRSEIQTVTYKEIAPPQVLLREPQVMPSLQPVNSVVAEVVDRTGRMGHLIKTDLGDYAVADDFTPVQPSQVTLEYHASYFTNHGAPVAGDKRVLACTDAIFQGDCLKNRGFLFVGWNYSSRNGNKVATGAYVSRIRYQVKVAGKVREGGGLDQVWGVLRKE